MPTHSRSTRGRVRAATSRISRRQLIIAGSVVGVLVLVFVLIAVTGGSTKKPPPPKHTHAPVLASTNCPLTDLPAPNGKVPQREPLAVKIGNETTARPQSGLNEADIVYDTPAEGGIMRYVAVFQCNDAPSIGPVRSVRWVDWHILQVFTHVELAFVGGVVENQATVAGLSFVDDANDFLHYSAYHDDPARTSPDSTYTSSATLWSLFKARPAPDPIFTYTTALPAAAKPASSLAIDFSAGTDVLWKWDPSTGSWLHTYDGIPDIDASTGQPVSTTNIIVQIVHYSYGPIIESPGGTGDVESVMTGSGPGYIFRNGEEIPVTWNRTDFNSTTTFTDKAGKTVGLAPGRTWDEIVLDTTATSPGAFTITK